MGARRSGCAAADHRLHTRSPSDLERTGRQNRWIVFELRRSVTITRLSRPPDPPRATSFVGQRYRNADPPRSRAEDCIDCVRSSISVGDLDSRKRPPVPWEQARSVVKNHAATYAVLPQAIYFGSEVAFCASPCDRSNPRRRRTAPLLSSSITALIR